MNAIQPSFDETLLQDVRHLIREARLSVAILDSSGQKPPLRMTKRPIAGILIFLE